MKIGKEPPKAFDGIFYATKCRCDRLTSSVVQVAVVLSLFKLRLWLITGLELYSTIQSESLGFFLLPYHSLVRSVVVVVVVFGIERMLIDPRVS